VGKSRLLQEVRTQALVQGVAVLRGQARAGGGALHLWQEVLPSLLLLAEPDELETAVLAPLIPDMERLAGKPVTPAPPLEPDKARTRLLLAILGLLQRAAQRQPLLLLLEDVHWADDNSLELLQWLLREVAVRPLLILAAYRLGERPDLPQQLPQLTHLRLERLAADQVAQLSAAMLGPDGRQPHLVTFLQQETEGNTFFMVEVMRALAEEAGRLDDVPGAELPLRIFSGGMKEVVRRRLARVPEHYRPLLQQAAVAGRQLDLTLLATVGQNAVLSIQNSVLRYGTLDDWLTICANALVLERPDGSLRWQFSHDKLRDGLLDDLTLAQKQTLHTQIAQAIEQCYADNLAAHYADLAHHFGQAGSTDQERVYLRLAAGVAQADFANEAALAFYDRLLALLVEPAARADAFLESAVVLKLVGRWQEAAERGEQAINQAAQTADPYLLGRCYQVMGNLCRSRGDYEAAREWMGKAQTLFTFVVGTSVPSSGDKSPTTNLVEVLVEIGNVYQQQGEYEGARPYLQQALAQAESMGDPAAIALALHNLGSNLYLQGHYQSAQTYYEQGLTIRLELADKMGCANAYNNLGNVAFRLGDYMAAQSHYTASLELRREIGDVWGVAASLNNLGIIPYHQQDYESARHYWEESLAIRRALGDQWSISQCLDNLSLIARIQGRYEQALRLSTEGIARRRQLADKQGLVTSLGNRARLLYDLGDMAAADDLYRESLALSLEIDDRRGIVYGLLGLAGVLLRLYEDEAMGVIRPLQLVTIAQQLLAEMGAHLEEDEREMAAQVMEQAEMRLEAAVLAAVQTEAATMAFEEVVDKVLGY
jgi:tetratricopeptide (TPR) repeat protein